MDVFDLATPPLLPWLKKSVRFSVRVIVYLPPILGNELMSNGWLWPAGFGGAVLVRVGGCEGSGSGSCSARYLQLRTACRTASGVPAPISAAMSFQVSPPALASAIAWM
jgi:hypothetical protein